MKIGIPSENRNVSAHFGHCNEMAFIETNEKKEITNIEYKVPPQHSPGVIPKFLLENNCDLVLTGGMGPMAVDILEKGGAKVITGVSADLSIEDAVKNYFAENLDTSNSYCNH